MPTGIGGSRHRSSHAKAQRRRGKTAARQADRRRSAGCNLRRSRVQATDREAIGPFVVLAQQAATSWCSRSATLLQLSGCPAGMARPAPSKGNGPSAAKPSGRRLSAASRPLSLACLSCQLPPRQGPAVACADSGRRQFRRPCRPVAPSGASCTRHASFKQVALVGPEPRPSAPSGQPASSPALRRTRLRATCGDQVR